MDWWMDGWDRLADGRIDGWTEGGRERDNRRATRKKCDRFLIM